ncbi:MAG: hypothetical protein R3D68_01160 [Hyphomicrobiaceae bacterium]
MFQVAADFAVGWSLRGMGLADQLARFATAEGWVYLGLLLVFAAMPVVVMPRQGPAST